ncbi:MAG: hypothetical protein ACKOQP_04100 [Bacteroidota bacterium]
MSIEVLAPKRMNWGRRPWALLVGMGLTAACSSDDPVPRPYGYAKAVLPVRQWVTWQEPGFPLRFEHNGSAVPGLLAAVDAMHETQKRPQQEGTLWMNLDYPQMGARIYLSYHPLNKVYFGDGQQVSVKDALAVLMAETQRMTFKHTLKASGIEETPVNKPDARVYGMVYTVRGNAASQNQFYVTDSLRHYLRGSLYFGATPNADSLQPYAEYLMEDVQRLLNTLRWLPDSQ